MADFDYSKDYQYTGILLFPLSIFGLLSNLTVVVFLRVIPSLNNPFGSLTLSQAVADCGHQFIFVFYYAPCLFLHSDEMYAWSAEMGFIIMIFYEICLISHVFISANRFFAVFTPLAYSMLFSIKNTRIMIATFWIFSVTSLVYKFKSGDCSFYLPQGGWFFIYTDSGFCQNVRMFDFYKFISYVFVIGVLDMITIVKVSLLRAQKVIGSTISTGRVTQTGKATVRRGVQMNLVYQAFFQGSLIFLELLTYFVLLPLARNKWEVFLLSSFTWCMAHAMDGFIVILCNREFRRQTKKLLLCLRSS